tara:strand:+ start:4888 stop:5064 length:177 start_codon:yes stop_codon:yes gene_type:complete
MPLAKSASAIKPRLISVIIKNPVSRGLKCPSIIVMKKTQIVNSNAMKGTTQGSLENAF